MIFTTTERDGDVVVLSVGEVVTVQIANCGKVNGENTRTARMIADTLTVTHCDYLWGLGPGMSGTPIQASVWLQIGAQPIGFDGATMDQAIAKAAARIRGEG